MVHRSRIMSLKSLFAVVFFSFYTLTLYSQSSVTVKSFAQTTDHISGSERRKDLNGVLCALIKVYVVDDIERVEGNKIGDIVKRGNVEKWVYMCKGSRNIRIHLRNHLPVRVMFQDYHINGLESNRVYELYLDISDMVMSAQTDNPTTTTGGQQTTPVYTQQKDNRQETPSYTGTDSNKDDQYGYSDPVVPQSATRATPPRSLNKSFKVNYEGVTFKCKAKKGYVTITGFDTSAGDVIIPGRVEFEGNYYPVREIDTFVNGNNYSATRLVIEDGVEIIDNYAFVEFRKLMDVTIPNSIKEIGKNAFRDNNGMIFNAPSNISVYDLRAGRTIKVR